MNFSQLFDNPLWIFCGFFVIMIPLSLGIGYWQRQQTRSAWSDLGSRTGLSLAKNTWILPPVLSGNFRDRPLILTHFSRSSGKSSTTYSRVTIEIRNPGLKRLRLSRSDVLSAIGQAFGAQDVKIGDDAFDHAFTIKSQPPEFAEIVLADSMLRSDLMRLERGWIEYENSSLTWETRGIQRDISFLERLFNTLSDLADAAEKASL